MRLFLLPISTRRTLIYCERVPHSLTPGAKQPIADRIIDKASSTWTGWEKAEKGWQKKVTEYGNHLFRRIPFEEWGLKTIPPATETRLKEIDSGKLSFECLYPGKYLDGTKVEGVLRSIATARQALHRKKMWRSLLWMPATLPFALVPVVPNLPFFYLCFRVYSHYRALYGGKMLEHLMNKNLVKTTASAQLDMMYTAGLVHSDRQTMREAKAPSAETVEWMSNVVESEANSDAAEVPVLKKWNGKLLAEAFHLPEMEVEIERAVEQVEADLQKQKDEKAEQARKEGEDAKKEK